MIESLLVKYLTSSLAQSLIKKVVIALLAHLVKKTDNKLDDELFAAIKQALDE